MKKIVIANWKMNPASAKEAERILRDIDPAGVKKTTVVVCPPAVYLGGLKKFSRKIFLGGQNVASEPAGPYTGEISAEMLSSLGAKYVIVGHSERRELGETNEEVNKKIKAALAAGLSPIVCVGEKERQADHAYIQTVRQELLECLRGVSKNLISKIIVAYEPIWAVSSTVSRRDATAADSYEMAIFIRKIISDISQAAGQKIKIIYGGSVNERNAGEFLARGGVDGVLVGKASLDAKKFAEIIKLAEVVK